MRRLPRLLLLGLTWLAATGHIGMCDLFRPATPERGGTGTLIHTNYTDPDSTLGTMARGMAAKGDGRDAYMGGIADTVRDARSFTATFDPAVLARYNSQPGAVPGYDPWTTDLERTVFLNFIQYKTTEYAMAWGPDNSNPIDDRQQDSAVLHRSYQITTQLSSSTLIIAVGYADLTFARTPSGRWVITRWDDRVDPAYGGANPSNPEQVPYGWRRLTQRG
jgi:hypothetical protein